jgi:effector-binding domain-containing protein
MTTGPRIVERDDQPYLGITTTTDIEHFDEILASLRELFGWFAERGLTPVGAPFFRYNVVEMPGTLEVEVGVPVGPGTPGDGRVTPGVLPAGRYASLTYVGPPDDLARVTAELLDWGAARGLAWDVSTVDGQERWGSRLEIYHTDPAVQPDMAKWETELAFRIAG